MRTFSGSPISTGNGSVYVPLSMLDTYKTMAFWSTYQNKLVGI